MYVTCTLSTLYSAQHVVHFNCSNTVGLIKDKKSCNCSLYKNAVGFLINAIRLYFYSVLLDDCSAVMAHLETPNEGFQSKDGWNLFIFLGFSEAEVVIAG